MPTGQDEAIVYLEEEKLAVVDHPTKFGSSTGNQQEEDGNSRDSGIVSDYVSPLKVVVEPVKVTDRKALTDKTNTDSHPERSISSKATKAPIGDSPVTSRRPPQRLLSYSLLSSYDEAEASVVSLPSLESVIPTNTRTALSSSSTSSFSCSEADIVWTPPKATVAHRRSLSEEKRASTAKFRKRSTESVMSESGVARKRSCAIRCDSIQSEINLLHDETFEPDDYSPNASYLSEYGLFGSTNLSRSFTRTQSTGQLELGEFQQKLPRVNQEVEYSLPGVENPQQESLAFRSISAATLASEIRRLGQEGFNRRYILVDCRYPYEYDGGHVMYAVNIHDHSDLESIFFPEDPHHPIRSRIPIFYCEFSQKRGPAMALALRSLDRKRNELDYPKVDYAEMYLLDQGYRKFWNDGSYKSECIPCGYIPMMDAAHVSSLIQYRWHRSKSTSQLVVREKERLALRKASFYRYRSLMQMCTELETNTELVVSPTAKTPDVLPRRLEFNESLDFRNAE